MIIPTDDTNAMADVASGVYEKHYKLKPGDKVLDIGAHVGAFAEYAARVVGHAGIVVAFEPHPRNFTELTKRCGMLENVHLNNAAAWSINGHASLWNNFGNSGGHSMFPCEQHDEAIIVATVDIADFTRPLQPNFVKMDCEGAESVLLPRILSVLTGTHIAFEAHSEKLYRECAAILSSYGYRILPETEYVGVCYAINP